MKKILIGIAIAIGIAIFALFMLSTLMPQNMADFFMGMGAVEYTIDMNDREYRVKFKELGEGVEPEDRLYVLKKIVATGIYSSGNRANSFVADDYQESVLQAAEDELLTAEEVQHLRELHSSIVTDEMVDNWIDMAKELEARKSRNKTETDQPAE